MTEQDLIRAVESIAPDEQLKRRVLSGEGAAKRKGRRIQSAFRFAAVAAAALVVFLGADYARSAMSPVGTAASAGGVSGQAAWREQVWNVLLLGENQPASSRMRNNSAILLTLNDSKKSVLFSFFPCDLTVEIPKNGTGRLGEAYQLGGTALSKETLERNFGVTVHNTLQVSPDLLTGLMGSVGGVSVTLTKEEAQGIKKSTNSKAKPVAGQTTLTGAAAYAYFTENLGDPTGLAVTVHQQETVRRLVNRLRGMDRAQLLEAVQKIAPSAGLTQEEAEKLTVGLQGYQGYTVYGFAPSAALAMQRQAVASSVGIKEPLSFVLVPALPDYRAVLQKMIGQGDFSAAQRLAG